MLRDGGDDVVHLGQEIAFHEPHDASAAALAAQLQRLGCTAWRCEGLHALRDWLDARAAGSAAPWLMVALEAPDAPALLDLAVSRLAPQHVIGMSGGESLRTEAMRQRLTVPRGIIKPCCAPRW